MSNYWKQSLVIGGAYWLLSLFLKISGIWWVLLIDLGLSLLLLLFLIPMKWLAPIKRVDNCINKHPIITTMLASVGWMPYYTAVIFIIASGAAMLVYYEVSSLESMSVIFMFTSFMVRLEKFVALIVVALTIFLLLRYKKSIAGPLQQCCCHCCDKKETVQAENKKTLPVAKRNTKKAEKKKNTAKVSATKQKAATSKNSKTAASQKAKKATVAKKPSTKVVKKTAATKKNSAKKK